MARVRIVGLLAMLLGIGILVYAVFGSMRTNGAGTAGIGTVSVPMAFLGLLVFIIGIVAVLTRRNGRA